jgi:glutamate synthase domain-containing protein 3
LYWNARGGSHTDGGAFIFTVNTGTAEMGRAVLACTDKFGRAIAPESMTRAPVPSAARSAGQRARPARKVKAMRRPESLPRSERSAAGLFAQVRAQLPAWDYAAVEGFLAALERAAMDDEGLDRALATLTLLIDRRYPTGTMKRSCLQSAFDAALDRLVDYIRSAPSPRYVWAGAGHPLPEPKDVGATLVLDARGFAPEGEGSLARAIVTLYRRGFHHLLVANTRGQRFIGCGLGPGADDLRIDVYGSPGDYLASGLDGAEVIVHGSTQDQLAQIMKRGKLVVYGDVGQTFMYAAKGGQAYVLGNAAGRPLINGVGRPQVVINGTCLDYLAESFMAGDPLHGGGFVVLNGLQFDEDGAIHDLAMPYPGGNLFSLASGGAIYLRDPCGQVTEDQLNGGQLAPLTDQDWELIRPTLEENEALLGVPLDRLLCVDGEAQAPAEVYRKVQPAGHKALLPEEAWVRREA